MPADYLTDLSDQADPKSVLKSLIVDGEDHTNDWSISDFTMAELKQWIGDTTYDAANERPKVFNGKLPIISFQDVIDIAKARSKAAGAEWASRPLSMDSNRSPHLPHASKCANTSSRSPAGSLQSSRREIRSCTFSQLIASLCRLGY